jgi:hypothetical protein
MSLLGFAYFSLSAFRSDEPDQPRYSCTGFHREGDHLVADNVVEIDRC